MPITKQLLQQIENLTPGRIDRVLAGQLGVSRSRCQAWIRAGRVQVDEVVVCKPSFSLTGGEQIEVESGPEPEAGLQPDPNVALHFIYENSDWVVLHKQVGQLVHPGAGRGNATLAAGMLARFPQLAAEFPGSDRPGVIHRLDLSTSGVLVWALRAGIRDWFGEQFALRKVGKWYLAWVQGDLRVPRTIEAPIRRSSRDRTHYTSRPGRGHSREALTRVVPVAHRSLHNVLQTLCVVRIHTGRTHQIRVHCADAGFAVVGDDMYGGATKEEPMLLHAWRLRLPVPDQDEPQWFLAPPPISFELEEAVLADWTPEAEPESAPLRANQAP